MEHSINLIMLTCTKILKDQVQEIWAIDMLLWTTCTVTVVWYAINLRWLQLVY